MDESRFSRGSWLVLAVALLIVLASAGQLAYRLAVPTDGFQVEDADEGDDMIATENVLGNPSTLQPGDVIVAIGNMRDPDFGHILRFQGDLPPGWQAGRTAPYIVRRQGELLSLDVPLYHWRLGPLLPKLLDPFLLAMLGLIALAGLVFFRQPSNWGARALLMVGASMAALGLSGLLNQSFDLLLPTALLTAFFSFVMWGTLLWPSFFFLSLSFPRPRQVLEQHPVLTLATIYLSPWLVLALVGRLEFGFTLVIIWSLLIIGVVIFNAFQVRDIVGRAQMRWAGMGVGLGALAMIINNSGILPNTPVAGLSRPVWRAVQSLPLAVTFFAPTVGFSIAILRYRLFEIDVIIRRTLVYSVLTALLALVYLGSVLVLQAVFGTLLGDSQNSLVAVLSTLAIAALFVPLRSRVQAAIDRRFYRRKYDAARTLGLFGARLRDEVDLDRLSEHLSAAAAETLEPAHISLWLRTQSERRVEKPG